MSLNGLDAAPVLEAYEAVGAEPGGWFLLKYASRDEIELLSRGNGGIVEVRNAVAAYDEISPLYGFLKYRRRSVVIKYLPEGCSRLIQARVAVHFNAVCERFSPYDTIFEMADAADLKDSTLSSACSLHAASASNASSSSSLRRRRLMEIAEEEEEEPRATKRKSAALGDGEEDEEPAPPAAPAEPVTLNAELATSPEHAKFSAATTSEVPNFVGVDATPASPTESTRTSFQSTRPDLHGHSSYSHSKHRVKLGPRPSTDALVRPQAAGNFQPVSSIPAGVKLFGKSHKKTKSRDVGAEASPAAPATAPADLPDLSQVAEDSETLPARPGTSSGFSTTSSIMPAASLAETTPAKPTMTREKARLMKAMQLREKKKQKMMEDAQQSGSAADAETLGSEAHDEHQPNAAGSDSLTDADQPADHPAEPEVPPETNDKDETEQIPQESSEKTLNDIAAPPLINRLSMAKADSGVVLDNLASMSDQASEQTATDSRSQSPVLASSEPDHSTQASSLLGSTDEPVLVKEEPADEEQDNHQESSETTPVPLEDAQASTTEQAPATEVPQDLAKEDVEHEDSILENQHNAAQSSQTEKPPVVETEAELHEEPEVGEIIIQLSDEDRRHIEQTAIDLKQPVEVTTADLVLTSESENDSSNSDKDQPATVEPGLAQGPEQPRRPALPISKFSAGSQRSQQAANPTVEIPQGSPKDNSTTPTNDAAPLEHITPRSKPSTQDLRAAAKATAQTSLPPPVLQTTQDVPAVVDEEAGKKDEPEVVTKPAAENPTLVVQEAEAAAVGEEIVADKAESTQESNADATEGAKTQPTKPPPLSILTDAPLYSREPSRTGTDSHLSDDEDLMDELQSAEVQEATPMTVAKTPVSPVFPTNVRASTAPPGHLVRTVSNPLRGTLIMPTDVSQSSARSVSASGAALLHKVTQQQTGGNLVRKGTVGSKISQRIKALEMLSVPGEAPAGQTRVERERPQSSFFTVKKSREPSRSPSVVDRASPFTRQVSTPSSRDQSPDALKPGSSERSRSVASRLSMFESPPRGYTASVSPSTAPPSRGRPESVSVTAKIVRDPNQNVHKSLEPPKDPSEFAPLDLKQSPLVVDHQRAQPEEPESSPETAAVDGAAERRMSRESHRSELTDAKENKRRSSLNMVRDFIKERRKSITSSNAEAMTTVQTSNASRPSSSQQKSHTVGSRLSISGRPSLSKDREAMSPTSFTESSVSGDESRSSSSDKKKSRTGRFMRRLSELSSSRGKVASPTSLSPPVAEEDAPEPLVARPSTMNTPAIVADMGDVNVQFPDTLLWKRRHMRLDAQGFLTLSAPPGAAGGRTLAQGTKRYHLSEFRPPYVPDVEVQELPNSVVLDLVEGSGVQVACEDRAGQTHVLQTLREAHTAHAAAFGR